MKRALFFLLPLTLVVAQADATLSCPQPDDYKWVMPAAAILGVGGGAIAGYGAGSKREKTRYTSARARQIQNATSKDHQSIAILAPSNDDVNTGPTVHVTVFAPNQQIYQSLLVPPDAGSVALVPLGGKDNEALKGIYSVVFTVETEGTGPSDLGGVQTNGTILRTTEYGIGALATLEVGRQQTLYFSYPSTGIENEECECE